LLRLLQKVQAFGFAICTWDRTTGAQVTIWSGTSECGVIDQLWLDSSTRWNDALPPEIDYEAIARAVEELGSTTNLMIVVNHSAPNRVVRLDDRDAMLHGYLHDF
jgi:hypothetical protein